MAKQFDIDDLVRRVGGPFKLSALVMKRSRDLIFGSPVMVEANEKEKARPIQVAMEEVVQNKILLGPDDGTGGGLSELRQVASRSKKRRRDDDE